MKSQFRRTNPLLLLLGLFLLSRAAILLINPLFDRAHQWQAHDAAMHFAVVLLLMWAAWVSPARAIAQKCLLLAWLGIESVNFIESLLNLFDGIIFPATTLPAQAALTMLLCSWYALRSYQWDSDAIDESHLFICRRKPISLQDILLAMVGRAALGSVAVLYRGQLWHYQHGVMVKTAFEHPHRYILQRAGIPSPATLQQLDALIGSKWTIFRNCLTTLLRIAAMSTNYKTA